MAETGFIREKDLESFLGIAQNFQNGEGERDPRPFVIAKILTETGMRISEVVGEHYDYYTLNGVKVSPQPTPKEAKQNGFLHITNEIGGLHIQDIDWDEKTIFIRKAKGNKSRLIPVSNDALGVIDDYLRKTSRTRESKGKVISGKMSSSWVRKLFTRISKMAGVSQIHPHLFRNTFAVRYLKRQGDIRVLQKILGHSSLAITEKYLKYTDEQVLNDYDKVMNAGG